MKKKQLDLTRRQREDLQALIARRRAPAGHVRRARVVLLSADGVKGSEIAERLDLSQEQVSRIRTRFLESGVEGLGDQPKAGRKDHAVSAEVEHRILELALSPPPAGRSRWTTRLLGREVKLTSWTVSKILRKHEVKPHLLRTYKVSRDPKFTEKVRDVVGLYLNPPENAVVLSVDEKTQVQALERTQLPLPLRQGRVVRHTHDYKRHGVVDLYAALNVNTGEVTHACTESHTGADFLSFMKNVARNHRRTDLHVILDNSSAHGTPEVKAWLAKNPRVQFHYTPTSASWLNQVEGFFGILSKHSLSLTNFPSKKALRDHIEAYIASWNENPTPFIWTKPARAIIRSHRKMLDRISHAVH
ncbi:MAG TPA: IS630 family transposase [Polyangiaceae bacterium]